MSWKPEAAVLRGLTFGAAAAAGRRIAPSYQEGLSMHPFLTAVNPNVVPNAENPASGMTRED